jgi:hypothetical protein
VVLAGAPATRGARKGQRVARPATLDVNSRILSFD